MEDNKNTTKQHEALKDFIACVLIKKEVTENFKPRNTIGAEGKEHDLLFIEKLTSLALGLQNKELPFKQSCFFAEMKERINLPITGFSPYTFYTSLGDTRNNFKFRQSLQKVKEAYKIIAPEAGELIYEGLASFPTPVRQKTK